MAVWFGMRTKHINTVCAKVVEFSMLNLMVHKFTLGIKRLMALWYLVNIIAVSNFNFVLLRFAVF